MAPMQETTKQLEQQRKVKGGGAAILRGVNFKILTDWFLGSFFDKGVLHGGHFNKFQESSTK